MGGLWARPTPISNNKKNKHKTNITKKKGKRVARKEIKRQGDYSTYEIRKIRIKKKQKKMKKK